jgi:tetratricopeptide (TPR) repeat protein
MNPGQAGARERMVRRLLTCLTVALVLGGLAWVVGHSRASTPSLAEVIGLAEAGRLDEAQAKVLAHLVADPADSAGHLLCAQILLKRPEQRSSPSEWRPSPLLQEALDHLDRVNLAEPARAVIVHLCRGNAFNRLMRFDQAESAWLEALNVNPAAPEAGWNLLRLYYFQARTDEARDLALRLYQVEPDPHDRACLLVELLRADARSPAPESIVKVLEPIDQYSPGEFHAALALGVAETRANKVESGTNRLRRLVESHPDRIEAWNCLLTGLDESGQVDRLEDELERLPPSLVASPRMKKHCARIAQAGGRWKEAVDLYRQARKAEPCNRDVEYRLGRALRHLGVTAEAVQIEQRVKSRDAAIQELRSLFEQATATPDLGTRPHPDLYQRIASARERMQLPAEAIAWHELVLRDDPKNEVSVAAIARLRGEGREQ